MSTIGGANATTNTIGSIAAFNSEYCSTTSEGTTGDSFEKTQNTTSTGLFGMLKALKKFSLFSRRAKKPVTESRDYRREIERASGYFGALARWRALADIIDAAIKDGKTELAYEAATHVPERGKSGALIKVANGASEQGEFELALKAVSGLKLRIHRDDGYDKIVECAIKTGDFTVACQAALKLHYEFAREEKLVAIVDSALHGGDIANALQAALVIPYDNEKDTQLQRITGEALQLNDPGRALQAATEIGYETARENQLESIIKQAIRIGEFELAGQAADKINSHDLKSQMQEAINNGRNARKLARKELEDMSGRLSKVKGGHKTPPGGITSVILDDSYLSIDGVRLNRNTEQEIPALYYVI